MEFSVSVPRVEPRDRQIAAIGIDIQSIKEMGASLEQFGERFTSRLFTSREIGGCHGNADQSARYFAESFSAKEAVLKIFDVRDFVPPWKSIELIRSKGGLKIELNGSTAGLARRQSINRIELSVSYDGDTVVAVAVARTSFHSA